MELNLLNEKCFCTFAKPNTHSLMNGPDQRQHPALWSCPWLWSWRSGPVGALLGTGRRSSWLPNGRSAFPVEGWVYAWNALVFVERVHIFMDVCVVWSIYVYCVSYSMSHTYIYMYYIYMFCVLYLPKSEVWHVVDRHVNAKRMLFLVR